MEGKSSNSPLKAGIGYTISNFIVKGMAFISMPIFTRFMTVDDIGSFANIQSWFTILAILTTFEIYSSVQLAQFDYRGELDKYIASTLILGTLITLLFLIIIIMFMPFFEKLFNMDKDVIILLFIYLLVYPAIQMFQIRNQIRFNYKPTIIISVGSTFVATAVSLAGVFFFTDQLRGRLYGYYIPLIAFTVSIYFYLLVKSGGVSTRYWSYALSISFPLIWHLLAANILNSSDRIMITSLSGLGETALYSVAYSCGMIVTLLWGSLNAAWSPWAYQQMDEDKPYNLRIKSKPYTVFFVFVVFVFILFSPELLHLMGGKVYMKAVYVIPPVAVGFIFQFIYSLYVNIEFYFKKQSYIALGTLISAVVNIMLNFLLIPTYGYIAAAYTTMAGYYCLLVIHYLFVKKLHRTDWYDTKFFVKIVIIAFSFVPISTIMYSIIWLRITIICLLFGGMLFFLIKNRKTIRECWLKRSFMPLMKIDILSKLSK